MMLYSVRGPCQSWIHRGCSGVTRANYLKLSGSTDPFYCYICLSSLFFEQTKLLKAQIDSLSKELAEVKANQATPSTSSSQNSSTPLYSAVVSGNLPGDPLQAGNIPVSTNNQGVPSSRNQYSLNPPPVASSRHLVDKKFSLVFYGIPECRKGTKWIDRCKHDLDIVAGITSDLVENIQADSIKDCVRLGKYSELRRSRPIMVKFNRFADVSNLLSKRRNLDPPFLIKPVMTLDERKSESILLKERWCLIQSGVDKKDIKIRGSSLYIKQQLHGKVQNSIFQPSTNTTQPPSSTIANDKNSEENPSFDEHSNPDPFSVSSSPSPAATNTSSINSLTDAALPVSDSSPSSSSST